MTKALSKELLPYNILVNTVCLTSIKSAQGETRLESGKVLLALYRTIGLSGLKNIRWGRLGEPSDAGALVAFSRFGMRFFHHRHGD